MNYTEMLNNLINESGMNQKEISAKCKELGEDVTTTYLSALKNTNGKMASDNISRVIAKACHAKYDEILVVQAYIDKAPQIIIDFLECFRKMQEQGAEFTQLAFAELPQNLKGISDEIDKINEFKSLAEFVCEFVEQAKNELVDFEFFKDLLNESNIDIGAQVKKKLVDNENWLLIPLGDMGKSQIVTKEEAEYIKNNMMQK